METGSQREVWAESLGFLDSVPSSALLDRCPLFHTEEGSVHIASLRGVRRRTELAPRSDYTPWIRALLLPALSALHILGQRRRGPEAADDRDQ